MIDNTKTYDLKTDSQKLIENPYLDGHWQTTVNSDSEPLYHFAEYLGLTFRLKNGKTKFQGSLHKYRNLGKHNYDDFSAVEVMEVVHELERNFEIDIYSTVLNNVEFGVNVVLPFGVNVVLDNLITYRGKHFEHKEGKGMNFYECRMSKFTIKIYDKGKQFKLPNNVLRFEIKVTAMQYLKDKGGIELRYLSDLLNMDIYEILGNTLTEVFDEILFGDNTINENNLTEKEYRIYSPGSNPIKWKRQTGEKERKRLQRLEHEFKSILERHRTGVDFRSVVSNLIRAKSLELSQISQNSNDRYNVFALGLFPYSTNEKDCVKGQFVPNINISHNRHLGQCTNDKINKCASCRKVLKENQISYCSDRCKIKKDKRNQRSNPRNDFKKQFKRVIETSSLFDLSEIIKLSEQQKMWIRKT